MTGRTLLVVLCALLGCVPMASAATPADLIAAYTAERDAAVADARRGVAAAGTGTEAAQTAAGDLRARLDSLAAALRTSTAGAPPEVESAVASRTAADADVADAVARHARGELDAARLDALLTRIEGDHARRAEAAGGSGMGLGDIVQAVGGPALLIGVVTVVSFRAARRRRPATR
jgi:hypothetical protein